MTAACPVGARAALLAAPFAALFAALSAALPAQSPMIPDLLRRAEACRSSGDLGQARALVESALERDDRHLPALALLAQVALAQDDRDAALFALHRLVEAGRPLPHEPAPPAVTAALAELARLDPLASRFRALHQDYFQKLLELARAYEERKQLHSALRILQHSREVLPGDPRPDEAIKRIRKSGGSDVAVDDLYAGEDPGLGRSEEWVQQQDALHRDWKSAWTLDTTNYRVRTNAGYRILRTAAIAMESMNGFYRRVFRYKEDGEKIPAIEIRIFKNRDEYLSLGKSPVPWSGGHFVGDAVETFVGGASGAEPLREMYGTLFHEAAHHFVSLTAPGAPGWLNEAYASFFEGTEILSNGSVRMNRVASHRLFPFATRMEAGWMQGPGEDIQADGTGDPRRAPTFRMVVEARYQWGPPWYAPTWGVVYFLYNYRNEAGRLVWRTALQAYYDSFKKGAVQDPTKHFETVVLKAPLSPAKTIDELDPIWKAWILALRDQQLGRSQRSSSLLQLADAALLKKDTASALELLEEALLADPRAPEVLWRLAGLLEASKRGDRAASLLREFRTQLELAGAPEQDPRYAQAGQRIEALDPLLQRYQALKSRIARTGIQLAQAYRDQGLPLMALAVSRRISAQFSMPEALAFYRSVAEETGRSLARWTFAYNEQDLRGWRAEGNSAYRAYGGEIRAEVADDASVARKEGEFITRALTCDVLFEADYSLEAQLLLEPAGRVQVQGLCFGVKDDKNFLALLVHPKGYLDLSRQVGGGWEILDHRELRTAPGWHTLRADVVGDAVDFWWDGRFVRSYRFPSDDALRGRFGLITGVGATSYRNIRLCSRDRHDPAARIERELALRRVQQDDSLREPGSFAGFPPPPLSDGEWMAGAPFDPRAPGWPTLLLFWTQNQEAQMPTLLLARHLAAAHTEAGIRVVLVAGERIAADALRALLGEASTGLWVLRDPEDRVFAAYGIKPGGFGVPRAVLVDLDGRVRFEGDPGLKRGTGWKEGLPTYLDDPLQKLREERKLPELVRLASNLASARAHLREERWLQAIDLLRPLAEMPAEAAPPVAQARALLASLKSQQADWLAEGEALVTQGRVLSAEALLARAAHAFPQEPAGKAAEAALRKLLAAEPHRRAGIARKVLDEAAQLIRDGHKDTARKRIGHARSLSDSPDIVDAAGALEEQLKNP